jgi:hypothetical protein
VLTKVLGTLQLLLRHKAEERGQAMLIVLAALAVMGTIPLVVVTTTTNQLPLSTGNLYWNAAYEAAQAGLADYIQQLDANETYAQWSNGVKVCNGTNSPVSPPDNPAFCGWESVPITTPNPPEWFEYSEPTISKTGISFTVSGQAGTGSLAVVRTFTYSLNPHSTLDDIYWTSHEEIDPALGGGSIQFDGQDVLNGPVFSNDDFYICGDPTFGYSVGSANIHNYGTSSQSPGFGVLPATGNPDGGPYWENTCSGGNQSCTQMGGCFKGGGPTLVAPENLITNGTGPALVPAQTLGCYIVGNVSITLSGSQLTWTYAPGQSSGASLGTSGNSNAACGAKSSGAPLGTAISFSPPALKAAIFYVDGDITINPGTSSCPGSVSGFLTLVSTDQITIDCSITYPSGDITTQNGQEYDSNDALGLIAENWVIVSDNNANTTLDASIMAINDSFYNADYTQSPTGTLTVFGSIAQNYRGPVGTLDSSTGEVKTGYAKAYTYDWSLTSEWPPFFIPPAGSSWNPTSYRECQAGTAQAALATPHC